MKNENEESCSGNKNIDNSEEFQDIDDLICKLDK